MSTHHDLMGLKETDQPFSAKFDALTGVRCIAACMIFLYHNRKYWRDTLGPFLTGILNEFHIGVTIFFVLSGFLIAYNYGDRPMQSTNKYFSYLIKRVARIFPVYWVILTCYYIDPKFGRNGFSWLTYTLTHGFSSLHNLDVIAQAWSLTVEMSFYIIAPLFFFLSNKRTLWVFSAVLFLLLLFWGIGIGWNHFNSNPQKFFYPFNFIIQGTIAGQLIVFLTGMFLAKLLRSKSTWQIQSLPHKTYFGLLGIGIVVLSLWKLQRDIFDQGDHHVIGILLKLFVLPIFVAMFFWGLISENNYIQTFLSSKILVILGNASFSFYLIHISYVNLKLKSYIFLPDRNFVLLWGLSIILYYLLEKPVYAFVRRRF